MPAGMTVYLDQGVVQIDDNFINLGLVGVYDVVCNTDVSRQSIWITRQGYLTVSGINPTIAIQSPVKCAVKNCQITGNSFEYTFTVQSPATIKVYVFDHPTAVSNYGLQTFNSQGQLVFDSGRKYMKVVTSVSFSDYRTGLVGKPVAMPSGNLALVQSGFIGSIEDYHDQYENGAAFSVKSGYLCLANIANNQLVGADVLCGYSGRGSVGNTSPYYFESPSGGYLVVDVAGL